MDVQIVLFWRQINSKSNKQLISSFLKIFHRPDTKADWKDRNTNLIESRKVSSHRRGRTDESLRRRDRPTSGRWRERRRGRPPRPRGGSSRTWSAWWPGRPRLRCRGRRGTWCRRPDRLMGESRLWKKMIHLKNFSLVVRWLTT